MSLEFLLNVVWHPGHEILIESERKNNLKYVNIVLVKYSTKSINIGNNFYLTQVRFFVYKPAD